MKSVHYMTLAAARNADPEAFDQVITKAVFAAAVDIGKENVIKALCGPSRCETNVHFQDLKAA